MVLDEEQNINGIITEQDILQNCGGTTADLLNTRIEDIMTPEEQLIFGAKMTIYEI